MHFLVFIFLLVMILASFAVLYQVFVAFVEDIGCRRWKWIPIHLVIGATLIVFLLHFVGLMVKLFNT